MLFLFQIVEPVEQPELTVVELLSKGGVVMYPIFLLSAFTIYLVVERLVYLNAVSKRKQGFIQQIKRALQDGDTKSARMFAEQDGSVTGKMILSALDYIGKPFREIESVMESSAEIEIGRMERNTGYLGIIAGVAPMLGFIGTISGVIRIFYNIAVSDNISIGIIAGGLYEKMITSGAGLVVGVIAFICYHVILQRIQRITLNLQEDALEFLKGITGSSK